MKKHTRKRVEEKTGDTALVSQTPGAIKAALDGKTLGMEREYHVRIAETVIIDRMVFARTKEMAEEFAARGLGTETRSVPLVSETLTVTQIG